VRSAASQPARAPVRITGHHLSRVLRASAGIGHEGARRVVDIGRSAVQQYDIVQRFQRFSPRTQRILADGSGDLDDSFRRAVHRSVDADGTISFQRVDRAVRQIDELDGATRQRAMRLVADTDADGLQLIDELDDETTQTLFRMDDIPSDPTDSTVGFGPFDNWDDWRANLAARVDDTDTEQIQDYIENVEIAGEASDIRNARRLVDQYANSGDEGQFRAQSGEASRGVTYADEGRVVEVEPGEGRFDLALDPDGDTVYVEIKDPESGVEDPDVVSQLDEMRRNIENSPEDVSPSNAVLEIRIRDADMTAEGIESQVRSGLRTHAIGGSEPPVRAVRVSRNGNHVSTLDPAEVLSNIDE